MKVARPATQRGARFLDALQERIPGAWDEPVPTDGRYGQIARDIDAMSSPSKLALLEAAATTLRPGEVYLEVGALFGVSAVAAASAGPHVRVIAIDNFSQFDGSPEVLLANVRSYGLDDRVELRIDDYRSALRGSFPPVGVYLYDGPHDYLDQYVGLELGLPHLADEAIVIVDDTRWSHVRRANLDFVATNPALTLLCDLPSPGLNHRNWWNGLQVFEYQALRPRGRRDLRFHLNRTRYAIMQPMRFYEIYYPRLLPFGRRIRSAASRLARGRAS